VRLCTQFRASEAQAGEGERVVALVCDGEARPRMPSMLAADVLRPRLAFLPFVRCPKDMRPHHPRPILAGVPLSSARRGGSAVVCRGSVLPSRFVRRAVGYAVDCVGCLRGLG